MKYMKKLATSLALTFVTLVGSTSVASANLIIQAEGRVLLQRETSDYYRPTNVGEILKSGDSLKIKPGASVKVLCVDDLDIPIQEVFASTESTEAREENVSSLCPQFLSLKGALELDPRPGGNDPQIPYILSPRLEYLRNEKPTFRWNKVAGATHYKVTLRKRGRTMWQTVSSSNKMNYPDEPPLDWGVEYLLEVEAAADNGSSSRQDGGANLGFEVLDEEDDVPEVEEMEKKINSSLEQKEKDLALAAVYSNEYLITDATDKLEEYLEKSPESHKAFVYRWLGDLYTRKGLNLKAQKYYSEAIELLTVAQDSYELAKAKAGLAVVKVILGQRDKELENQAKDGYQALGYSEMVEELERQLEKAVRDSGQPVPPDEILTPSDFLY